MSETVALYKNMTMAGTPIDMVLIMIDEHINDLMKMKVPSISEINALKAYKETLKEEDQ